MNCRAAPITCSPQATLTKVVLVRSTRFVTCTNASQDVLPATTVHCDHINGETICGTVPRHAAFAQVAEASLLPRRPAAFLHTANVRSDY